MKAKVLFITILVVSLILFQEIRLFPWWAFTVFLFLIAVVLPNKKWKETPFVTGFLANLFAWVLPYLFYEFMYDGNIMKRVAALFELPQFLIFIVIGILGGLLGGLSFYAGTELRKGRTKLQLELEDE